MERIDKDLQNRVWQRVQGRAEDTQPRETDSPAPEGMLLGELSDLRLLGQLGSGDALRQLGQQLRDRADVLRGLCALLQATPPDSLPRNTPQTPRPALLRQLMGSLLRRQKQYCRMTEHPEYGTIYDRLARSAADSCLLLAKHIGTAPLHNRRK